MFSKNSKREIIVNKGNIYKLDLQNNFIEIFKRKKKLVKGNKKDNYMQFKNQLDYFLSSKYNLKKSIIQAELNIKIFNAAIKSDKLRMNVKI